MKITTRFISSLEKLFSDAPIVAESCSALSVLRGEVAAFQVAVKADSYGWLKLELKSELPNIVVREVGNVPCELPGRMLDDDVLRNTPGLYPDPLMPFDGIWQMRAGQVQTLWISVAIPENCQPGNYRLELEFAEVDFAGTLLNEMPETRDVFEIEVMQSVLPPSTLMHSEWFHADCIYTYYQVECWSEKHWQLLENYFRSATRHGINMLLTPLWTPPLDTAINTERPTVQLLDIEWTQDGYRFDFSRLERWFNLGRECGFKYFDFAHFFTQWGAGFTPKIMVRKGEKIQKLFGWHVPSDAPEYAVFLQQMLAELLPFVRRMGLIDNVLFHVSDEPATIHLDNYKRCVALIKPLIGDIPILDALSHREVFLAGGIDIPACTSDELEVFLDERPEKLFTYYCVAQFDQVANRFFCMSSARNRILGIQLYLYDLTGFLHWGFNFWYTQYSLKHIDPFKVTDAGGAFSGGDAFLVYPGENGPIDSIRYEVLTEGLNDLRALRLLEQRIGREKTIQLIHEDLNYHITMKRYPRSATWLLGLRRKINLLLK